MPIPSQRLSIRDPGLGLVAPAGTTFAFVGTSEKGPIGEVRAISTPAALVDTYGEGPLSEAVAYALSIAGGPQLVCRVTGSVAAVAGAVTATRAGTSTGTVTVAGAPNDDYRVRIEITRSGALGTATFRYSLDGGLTWSESRTIPVGGTYLIPRTGLTVTFVAGAGPVLFERGDAHAFDATAPHYGATEVGAAMAAITTYLSTSPGLALDAVVLTGTNASGAAAATNAGALSVGLATLQSMHQYAGGMLDAGSREARAAVKTALLGFADARVLLSYGHIDLASPKSFSGFSTPRQPLVNVFAARAAASRISVDLARTAGDGREGGPILGAQGITHDEYVVEEMDAAKIATARTWPGINGYFLTNGNLKSPLGSDFLWWQHRRVMDVACRTTIQAQQQFMSAEFLTKKDGSLEEREARRIEEIVKDKLREQLVDPQNASGRQGHVSDFSYQVDRTNNVVATATLRSRVAIRPLGYSKWIETEIGFALNVGA